MKIPDPFANPSWHFVARLSLVVNAVGAVCRGGIFSLANEDRVLTTSTCSDDLLATNSSVVDQSRSVDIVDRALAGLVVAGEAPGVDLAIGGNGEVVIGTSSDGDDVLDVWNMLVLVSDVQITRSTHQAGL